MMLPQAVREAILKGLGSCNLVGVQTEQDVRNLLDSWQLSERGVIVDRERSAVITPEGRTVVVKAYPISVDVADLREMATSAQVRGYRSALERAEGEKLVVRVDRLDPIKNVVTGFLAYERLLEEQPQLHGKVRFLALLVPSRQQLRLYQRYRREAERVAERVNSRFGREGWRPVTIYLEENRERAVALLQEYDVLVVNSLMDGMNLVAKEGSVLNGRNGVIILSATAGCYREMAEGVIPVGPADVDSLKKALYDALTLSPEERTRRASLLREAVSQKDITRWLTDQLEDLDKAA